MQKGRVNTSAQYPAISWPTYAKGRVRAVNLVEIAETHAVGVGEASAPA
jgi:hypothetical protein